MSRQDIANEVLLEIEAGSHGPAEPSAGDGDAQRIYPLLIQLPGIDPEFLAKDLLRRMDDRLDLTQAFKSAAAVDRRHERHGARVSCRAPGPSLVPRKVRKARTTRRTASGSRLVDRPMLPAQLTGAGAPPPGPPARQARRLCNKYFSVYGPRTQGSLWATRSAAHGRLLQRQLSIRQRRLRRPRHPSRRQLSACVYRRTHCAIARRTI